MHLGLKKNYFQIIIGYSNKKNINKDSIKESFHCLCNELLDRGEKGEGGGGGGGGGGEEGFVEVFEIIRLAVCRYIGIINRL